MFIIMKDDKSLAVSKPITIYQREKLVDKIRFIIPQTYEDVNLSECKLVLKYKNQINEPKSEILIKSDEMYKDSLQYILPIDTKFTQLSGDITMRLTFIKAGIDGQEENILHTGSTTIHVIAVDDWYQYIPDNSLEIIDNLIIKNEKQIQELKKISTEYAQTKADDLSYENGMLQLLAKGEKIGKGILISIQTDPTLLKEGFAADAKSVGDKLNELENKKLNNNLGEAYANKILGIDSEGNIVPKDNIELDYNNVENKPRINDIELSGNKTLDELGIQEKGEYALKTELPKNTSQLNNDSGFLTSVPEEYITDSELSAKQFATKSELPKKVSELQNDSGFISKVPDEYVTETELTGKGYALKTDIPKSLPASDVSAWAKEPQKPVYTATEVGADTKGSASTAEKNAKKYTDSSLEIFGNEADKKYALKTEVIEIDLTLTQTGKAADSKTVGDKISSLKGNIDEIDKQIYTITPKETPNEVELAELKDLNGKLDKNQGTENADKFLSINKSGEIVPSEIPSEYITEAELNGKKFPNPHKLTFEGSVTAEYDGSGAVSVVIPETGSIERVEKLSSDTTVDILPNKLYVFPEMDNLTITLGAVSDTKIVNEYHFVFKSGATPTVLSIPQSVNTPSSFSVLANTVYEVSIMENCMTYQSWEVSA